MMERPSESDPPAANQPLDDEPAAEPTKSDAPPSDLGKPDGEVDTGA